MFEEKLGPKFSGYRYGGALPEHKPNEHTIGLMVETYVDPHAKELRVSFAFSPELNLYEIIRGYSRIQDVFQLAGVSEIHHRATTPVLKAGEEKDPWAEPTGTVLTFGFPIADRKKAEPVIRDITTAYLEAKRNTDSLVGGVSSGLASQLG